MLKYGMYAKAVELLCFKQALARLAQIYPDMDMKRYKRSVKRESTRRCFSELPI